MKKKDKKTVAVLFGGPSVENEISVITGLQVYENIDREQFEPLPLFVTRENKIFMGSRIGTIEEYAHLGKLLSASKEVVFAKKDNQVVVRQKGIFAKEVVVDMVHICFHGGIGEGGGYQGYFDVLGVPYTGCSSVSAGLCMDKSLMKQAFAAEQIPCAEGMSLLGREFGDNTQEVLDRVERKLGYPVFVKPARSGSSIGVNKVKNTTELRQALEVAFLIDSVVLVEASFENAQEYNISVMGSFDDPENIQPSEIEEVFSQGEILDFENKYLAPEGAKKMTPKTGAGMASVKRKLPADISPELKTKIQHVAQKAFVSCQCSGVVRIDFLARPSTLELIVVEVNTFPGSMAYYLWEASGVSFVELNSRVLQIAQDSFGRRKQDPSRFTTDILSHYKPAD